MAVADLQADRRIQVIGGTFVSPLTGDSYIQKPYEALCSSQLTKTGRNYRDTLTLIPQGYRMSVLEEIDHLIELESRMKAEGKSPREALEDPLFKNFIRGNPYLWEWTLVAFRAPEGTEDFTRYTEKDGQGREYARGDYLIDDRVVAEGVLIPVSRGGKVVEWNRPLRIPAVVSEGSEPGHTTHHYFDPEKPEVAVELHGDWHDVEHDRCLAFDAYFGRSSSNSYDAFRVFQGSLDYVTLPTVEYFIKDKYSFERGLARGRAEGLDEVKAEGIELGRQEVLDALAKVLRSYGKQV